MIFCYHSCYHRHYHHHKIFALLLHRIKRCTARTTQEWVHFLIHMRLALYQSPLWVFMYVLRVRYYMKYIEALVHTTIALCVKRTPSPHLPSLPPPHHNPSSYHHPPPPLPNSVPDVFKDNAIFTPLVPPPWASPLAPSCVRGLLTAEGLLGRFGGGCLVLPVYGGNVGNVRIRCGL